MTKLNLDHDISDNFLIAFFGSMFFYVVYSLSYIINVVAVYCHARSLNKGLKLIDGQKEVHRKKFWKRILTMHDSLCDLNNATSSYNAINGLIFQLSFFAFGIFFSYSVFVFLNDPTIEVLNILLSVSLFLFFYFPYFIFVATISHLIEAETMKTVSILEDFGSIDGSKSFHKNLNRFCIQTSHRRPIFSCGLYEVDWKWVFGFMAGVFSNSIILIQFYDVRKS